MKRHILLTFAICLTIIAECDVRVSLEEAQEKATAYYQKIDGNKKGMYKAGTPESISLLGLADMWLVPINDSWILVSSDKRTEAILARFMEVEKPDFKSLPPAAQYLISCYEHDIAYVRDSCKECRVNDCWNKQPQGMINRTKQNNSLPSEVEPLLGYIQWDQYGNNSYPISCEKTYNKFCPEIVTTNTLLCNHAVVGCVAVAIGQIMRYWQWPYSADVPTTVGGSIKEKSFYDWDLMPNYLTNSVSLEEANMVAGFLRDLGYDLDMDYGESSGATDYAARSTFVNFGYDDNTLTHRAKWKTPGWTNYLHSEIAAGRPVYYSGRTALIGGNGHAFVLDGYDAGHLYHVNLGWGGYLDGYYFIDTISPGTSSFSHSQAAIWGIQPASNYCTPLTVSSVESPKFCIAQAGTITLNGVNISNVSEGKVYSSESIILGEGTSVNSGSNVHFAIKTIPCSSPIDPMLLSTRMTYDSAPTLIQNDDDKSRVTFSDEIIKIESVSTITGMFLFGIDGRIVRQSNNASLSTNNLPNGVYVVKVIEENYTYQTKFVLQR
ncbi:MAG: C10 family peptidase [Paludibacteraceae bacterium]|nr:C10 family peptidase [Paludibacteraceae bacterium]